ncbi:hypothetical protein Cadr_000002263 [Camelus dromedarius]|uniref:Uncharacterized protein n=1 Tax=Camelus dromedarius TaxID=9838 RepID=A0A5N4EHP8_CAMDR|nr:hypothetical protein Cadr_000002263 [Camelus dromedarius]
MAPSLGWWWGAGCGTWCREGNSAQGSCPLRQPCPLEEVCSAKQKSRSVLLFLSSSDAHLLGALAEACPILTGGTSGSADKWPRALALVLDELSIHRLCDHRQTSLIVDKGESHVSRRRCLGLKSKGSASPFASRDAPGSGATCPAPTPSSGGEVRFPRLQGFQTGLSALAPWLRTRCRAQGTWAIYSAWAWLPAGDGIEATAPFSPSSQSNHSPSWEPERASLGEKTRAGLEGAVWWKPGWRRRRWDGRGIVCRVCGGPWCSDCWARGLGVCREEMQQAPLAGESHSQMCDLESSPRHRVECVSVEGDISHETRLDSFLNRAPLNINGPRKANLTLLILIKTEEPPHFNECRWLISRTNPPVMCLEGLWHSEPQYKAAWNIVKDLGTQPGTCNSGQSHRQPGSDGATVPGLDGIFDPVGSWCCLARDLSNTEADVTHPYSSSSPSQSSWPHTGTITQINCLP